MSVGANRAKSQTASGTLRANARRRSKLLTSDRNRNDHLKTIDVRTHKDEKGGFVKPANLNEYLHILSESNANDIDLAWILKLRLNNAALTSLRNKKRPSTTFANPPSVFFKQTKASKGKKVTLDSFKYNGNHADIEHLTRHRLAQVANPSQLTFETGLRTYQSEHNLNKRRSASSQKRLSQSRGNSRK
uniref:Uncharacterized protein n=1 Tax=Euplotes crassus TaxID=5936 RepID=A0A7S3NUV5_EUPCR|mmetsp:Transcript_22563/g.22395  ORF Transcript_22563/g.22395 Transcript_22563/m.22395 type:complete len:189 (+) Transcript_22563:3-569(+)